MREIIRTNDMVLISYVESLLRDSDIGALVLDGNMSVIEGSVGVIPRRVLVEDERYDQARRLLTDAGLGHELRPAT